MLTTPSTDPDERHYRIICGRMWPTTYSSFFVQIRKDIEIKDGLAKLPSPPFHFLYGQKERIRFALVAYIHLNKIRKAAPPNSRGAPRCWTFWNMQLSILN